MLKLINNYKIKTPNGYEDFKGFQSVKKHGRITIQLNDGKFIKCSLTHRILTDFGWKIASDIVESDKIYTNSGISSIFHVEYETGIFNYVDVLGVLSEQYFANGIVSHNCEFLGSSNTLIDGKKLQQLTYRRPIYSQNGLDIYEHPLKDCRYLITVDTSRGVDIDYSAFIIFDITTIPYKIVGKFRKADIPPLLYPNVIIHVAQQYNRALVLVETNDIGQQVADILHMDLEYEGVLTTAPKGRAGLRLSGGFGRVKPQLGIRTTKQTKRIGCGNFKTLVESDRLIINDFDLLYEMARFIEVKASYEAEEGEHDDLVMCCVLFSWLVNQPYFKEATENDIRAELTENTEDYLMGFQDDGTDEYSSWERVDDFF